MNRDQMLELLERHKIPFYQQDISEGGTVVAARRGARLLGLFPSRRGNCPSALWINPHLRAILEGHAADWAGDSFGGMGGDRLWISPERNYYYGKPATFEDFATPAPMDPGTYTMELTGSDAVVFENRLDLTDRLRGITLGGIVMRRRLRTLENPLAASPRTDDALWKRISYVGVDVTEEIEVSASQTAEPAIAPWGLTQVPVSAAGCATVVIPAKTGARPIGYFGPVGEDRLRVSADHVSFKVDAQKITKIALRPEDIPDGSPARIAYVSPVAVDPASDTDSWKECEWMVLIRESDDVARTSDEAVDPSKADPGGPRGVIQSYCNGPSGGPEWARFGEVELQHRPVRPTPGGGWSARAVSRILVYEGNRSDILDIVRSVLRVESVHLFK